MEIEEDDPLYLPEDHNIIMEYDQRVYYRKYAPWIVSSVIQSERLQNFEFRYLPCYTQFSNDLALCKKLNSFLRDLAFKYIQLRLKIEYSGIESIIFSVNWMNIEEYLQKDRNWLFSSHLSRKEICNYLLSSYKSLSSLSSGKLHPDCLEYQFFPQIGCKASDFNKILFKTLFKKNEPLL